MRSFEIVAPRSDPILPKPVALAAIKNCKLVRDIAEGEKPPWLTKIHDDLTLNDQGYLGDWGGYTLRQLDRISKGKASRQEKEAARQKELVSVHHVLPPPVQPRNYITISYRGREMRLLGTENMRSQLRTMGKLHPNRTHIISSVSWGPLLLLWSSNGELPSFSSLNDI